MLNIFVIVLSGFRDTADHLLNMRSIILFYTWFIFNIMFRDEKEDLENEEVSLHLV